MAFDVAFHPIAETDLFGLYDYIESRAGVGVASGYIERIERLCESLADLPERGTPRDDLSVGVRTLSMERRVMVVYRADGETVTILRVLYEGRSFGPDDPPR